LLPGEPEAPFQRTWMTVGGRSVRALSFPGATAWADIASAGACDDNPKKRSEHARTPHCNTHRTVCKGHPPHTIRGAPCTCGGVRACQSCQHPSAAWPRAVYWMHSDNRSHQAPVDEEPDETSVATAGVRLRSWSMLTAPEGEQTWPNGRPFMGHCRNHGRRPAAGRQLYFNTDEEQRWIQCASGARAQRRAAGS